ncbi:MAG TPA: cytosine permease [Streptosporangiaceae bacterium]|jgi:NCS1 family nucleobase:cation symporter-1|nr:cytosine permease [Streptosporangiaceae bacterium]
MDGGHAPSVTAVEHRGIEHIPQADRWGKPSGLFWMWAGAVWNVEFVYYGAIAVVFLGLSFAQAVLIILLGNLSYVLTGLASVQGPQAGTTTFAISRAPFGPRGNKLPSFFNWVTQVGFEIEGIAFIVFAAIVLMAKAGFTAGVAAKIIFIILAVAIQAILPTLGHAAVLKVLRWLAIPFVILFAVLAGLTATKANLHAVTHGAGWGELFVFLALVISAGGLGWTENGNDYSRYLPADSDNRAIVVAVALGAAIPSALLEILGAAVGTAVPSAADSPTGLISGFSTWFVVPFLIFAIVQLFAINTLDLYSSGVTLQSIIPKLHRLHCVAIDTLVCAALAAYAVFSSDFFGLLTGFLLYIILWLGPWCAIYLVDSYLRRNRYDQDALLNETSSSRYFRSGGVYWPAVIAQVVGGVCAYLWLNASSGGTLASTGPLSSRTSGSDFSVFIGLFVGGVIYYVLASRTVRAEGDATPVVAAS